MPSPQHRKSPILVMERAGRFSQDLGNAGKLTPSLRSWTSDPAANGERTVIVRIGPAADPKRAAEALTAAGVKVDSAGHGVIAATVSARNLVPLSELPWVLAVEEPKRYFPRQEP